MPFAKFCKGIEVASENAVIVLPDQIVEVCESFDAIIFVVHASAVPLGQTEMII